MSESAITKYRQPEDLAGFLVSTYDTWKSLRSGIECEWQDTQSMIFATDAAQAVGAQASSSWRNNTTRGKLAQIRDNLHSNYYAAIMNNRNWLKWDASKSDPDINRKRQIISSYMKNKLDLSGFENVVSQLLADYIDYGVCFASTDWVDEKHSFKKADGTEVTVNGYTGAVAKRHSPHDCVINPASKSIKDSPQFTRELKTIGELLGMVEDRPQDIKFNEAVESMLAARKEFTGANWNDTMKNINYDVQGFSSYHSYMSSGTVELITFTGSIVDHNGKLLRDKRIVIADRCTILVEEDLSPSPSGSYLKMAGWRDRPDNLYAQSPLAKLIGMQFRVDKLENTKADAMDLAVEPPIFITGDVDDFTWQPGEVIGAEQDGNIQELGKNLNSVIAAQGEIQQLEAAMEEFAGAPKQSMGFRTPGEKTAFEVQSLETAGSRIFQQKIFKFEREILEPLLNDMLNLARQNLQQPDTIKVIDPDFNAEDFIEVTVDDLIADGTIRAVGSRHFITKSQTLQELVQLSNTALYQQVMPHISTKQLTALLEELMAIEKYDLFRDKAGIEEQAELQQHIQNLQTTAQMEQAQEPELTEEDLQEAG